ncbi:MFS transporter [Rathayibacter sp. ZW T2_19]|uniref:MFS transporter n=1 Tax=Rathayibacter rubneri TaxID=2950106 RepID=A0A9X2DXR0_9MICO|nr:MFS transporter [Rathayibacter rubneri]MCM6761146.1 MFS transporter [Rathayibacter rubneri]
MLALVILYIGTYSASVGMAIVAWPVTVAELEPDDKVLWLSLLTGLYALVNIVITPLAGALSDRSTSRLGMRKPFIAAGVLFALAGLVVMGLSASVAQLLLGAVLLGIGNAVITGGAGALVPDQVPEQHRGRVQGIIMVCIVSSGVLASIFLPMFLGNRFLLFTAPGYVMIVALVMVLFILRDRRLSQAERDAQPKRNILSEFKINPRSVPDYSWVWIGKVVVVLGTVLTSTYGVYVLTDQLGVGPDELPGLITITGLVGLVTAILGAVLGSQISDRLKIRKSLVIYTTLFIAAGAIIVAFSPSVPVYMVGLVLLGLGSGAYSPVDGALVIDVLPGEGRESGKYMSLIVVADQLPRSFGPILGSGIAAIGALTAIGGYSLVYLVGAVIAVVGGLFVRKVRGSM